MMVVKSDYKKSFSYTKCVPIIELQAVLVIIEYRSIKVIMMTLIETVSKQLKISQDDLVHQSIQTFLEKKLAYVESELFVICKNYGVNNIIEMDGFL